MKRSNKTRNLKIATRISIATLASIITSVVMVIAAILIFRSLLPDIYGISRVESNEYSIINQLQWAQTISSINRELADNGSDEEIEENLSGITKSISELGSKIYISKNGKKYFSNTEKNEIKAGKYNNGHLRKRNMYYYGKNGLVIRSHIKTQNGKFAINIVNPNYTVSDYSLRNSLQSFKLLFTGRSGFMILMALLIIIVSNLIMSLITSRTITAPIKKLSDGANEIAGGNLDCHIDYDSTNEIGATVKSINDMTDKLKYSIERQNEMAQSRKEMTAGIAHDLRTPLTSIKGYVEGLRDGIANTPEKQERYLQTIYSSALDMEKLLDELLTLSKLESGNTQLDLIKIDINEYLAEYLAEKENKWQTGNITIKYSGPNTKGKAYVMLDPNRFSRVLNNIISNAVKYSSKERKPVISISLEIYDKSIIIAISDNGIGISEENLKHIFDIFYRADQARTRVYDGSGLGLAVCKEIVELHQGHIWATSKEGHGTTIMISLNREDA
ncbi:MAG: ATP-binding protein [Eubacterium sp.]